MQNLRRQQVDILHSPALAGMHIISARHVTAGTPRHFHDGYQISLVERGAIDFSDATGSRTATSNGIILYSPQEAHGAQPLGEHGWSGLTVHIDTHTFEEARSSTEHPWHNLSAANVERNIQAGLLNLRDVLLYAAPLLEQQEALLAVITSLILPAYANRSSTHRESQAVRRVCDYIQAHYAGNIELDTLASLVHMSKFHLVHVFQSELGLPPHAYQIQVRLIRARQLLKQGRPASIVAHECGFTHTSHLTRYFRRFLGVSPGRYFQTPQ